MLTKKQRDLLIFIHERMVSGDVAPSFEEMKDHLGLRSKSGIHRLISALVERGYLERLPHRARALEVKKLPEGYHPDQSDSSTASRQHNEIGALSDDEKTLAASAMMAASAMSIPLCGKIAAGTPIEAIRDDGSTVDIPPHLLGTGEHYALEVDGDSMIKAGINDGDIVIIRRCDTAENGAIVVALVDEEEATLKRLYRSDGKIVLEPENDAHEPQIYAPERVRVQGKLVSLFRSYG